MPDETQGSDPAVQAAMFELRQRMRLTQKTAAQLAGITTTTWNRIECGRWPISREIAYRLAEFAHRQKYEDLFGIFAAYTTISPSDLPQNEAPPTAVIEHVEAIHRDVRSLRFIWDSLLNHVQPLEEPSSDPDDKRLRARLFNQLCERFERDWSDLSKRLGQMWPDEEEKKL